MNQNHLGNEILKSVSRSFYLTIRVLPRELREPIGLAYLLARTSDTIADSTTAPAEVRLKNLAAFREMIEQGLDSVKLRMLRAEIVPADTSERYLIDCADECLTWLHSVFSVDRADIVDVLRTITRGQELDLVRLNSCAGTVANTQELEEYTYLVAGCVGEFWTRICFRHVANYASLDIEAMEGLGRNFGKGLQLVNILRDLPADLKSGRCYLPNDELAAAHIHPKELLTKPFGAHEIVEKWIARAEELLADGKRYIDAIRSWRLRYACILPWALGVRTLLYLRKHPPLETSVRIKVPRHEVRAIMVRSLFDAVKR